MDDATIAAEVEATGEYGLASDDVKVRRCELTSVDPWLVIKLERLLVSIVNQILKNWFEFKKVPFKSVNV